MTLEPDADVAALSRCINTGRWSAFSDDNEPERASYRAALDRLAARAQLNDWSRDLAKRLEDAEDREKALREVLEELSTCVMRGWTDPAFARGPLHRRAVQIARAVPSGKS